MHTEGPSVTKSLVRWDCALDPLRAYSALQNSNRALGLAYVRPS